MLKLIVKKPFAGSLIGVLIGANSVFAQPSETTAFLANLSNEYRAVSNVVYHVANNHENVLDVYVPVSAASKTPVLLMIHGGGWVGGGKERQFLRSLPYLEMGWAVVNIAYRLAEVSLAPAAVEDCLCALQWIARNAEQYNFDVSRIVTSGNSAGGHLALTTAMIPESTGLGRGCFSGSYTGPPTISEVPVAAVINWYGITDVVDIIDGQNTKGYAVQWLGSIPDRQDVAALVSPVNYVRPELPPVFTVHGDSDPIVPYQQAVRLHEKLDASDVENELFTVSDGGHGGFNRSETVMIYERILAFLNRHGL